jgi:hypothetical protein
MPRFDGTGPQGQGPMTGRGEGYCAVRHPDSGEASYGYAGVQGTPMRMVARPTPGGLFARWIRPVLWLGRGFGRWFGRGFFGRGRGRGRRFGRW